MTAKKIGAKPYYKWTPEKLAEAKALVEQHGITKAAKMLNRARGSLACALDRHDIKFTQNKDITLVGFAEVDNYDPWIADLERLLPFTGKILRGNELYHQWEGGNKPTPSPDKYDQDLTILKVNTSRILVK